MVTNTGDLEQWRSGVVDILKGVARDIYAGKAEGT